MNTDLKYDKINIELRRGKVLELLAKGCSQTEIAKTLNVSNALISLDIQYLREQAQKELETHIESKIPLEYTRAMAGLNILLRKANETLDNATDPKIKLQTMALLMDLYNSIMTLNTNGGIIQQAMKRFNILKPFPGEKIPTESELEAMEGDDIVIVDDEVNTQADSAEEPKEE
jgi:predicted transcriptional regulator